MSFIYNQKGISNQILLLIVAIVVVLGGTTYVVIQNKNTTSNQVMMEKESADKMIADADFMTDKIEIVDEVMKEEDKNVASSSMMDNSQDTNKTENDTMMDASNEQEVIIDDGDSTVAGTYIDYTAEAFTAAADMKRVLFFHASWCPTCKMAHTEINSNLNKLPKGMVLFKTDYDSQNALKQKYGITYQHTFVQVDSQGNEIAKWNGGGIDEIIKNVK